MDEDLAQVPVAALADPVEPCVAIGLILAWHNAEPRSELSSPVEGCPVADRRDDRGRDRRSDARDLSQNQACGVARSVRLHRSSQQSEAPNHSTRSTAWQAGSA